MELLALRIDLFMERRKISVSKSSSLPLDYLKMVNEVFSGHFEESLKALNKLRPQSRFEVLGEVYTDEILLAVSLISENSLSATTAYASVDFDPKASAPEMPDLLSAAVDAIAVVFDSLLNLENEKSLSTVADDTLSALENVPFIWTETEANQKRVYVKVDKSNLKIDQMTDQWLAEHDRQAQEEASEEQKASEGLFVTGKKH